MDQWQLRGGWLGAAHCIASPNYDQRPDGARPELLVVHNISLPAGEYGGDAVSALFCNCLRTDDHPDFVQLAGLRVSAHFFIRRGGELIQFVPTQARAWHAGVSQWRSRQRCNDFSIGIELEGTDTEAYTDPQYDALVKLVHFLLQQYPDLAADAIVGHSDIAPGRKTDPGEAFDWERLHSALASVTGEGDNR